MKSVGIVRRIDGLGRIVMPMEIRKTLLISECEPMEIFTDGDMICIKKFDSLLNFQNNVEHLRYLIMEYTEKIGEEKASEIREHLMAVEEIFKGKTKASV